MSGPAYQLISDTPMSGGYGTIPYGSGSYGITGEIPLTVPQLNYGSDDLTQRYRRRRYGPRHERDEAIIGQRTWTARARWRVVHKSILAEEVAALQVYYDAQIFRLLPTGNPSDSAIRVAWVTESFDPQPLRGGTFDLEYELEELR